MDGGRAAPDPGRPGPCPGPHTSPTALCRPPHLRQCPLPACPARGSCPSSTPDQARSALLSASPTGPTLVLPMRPLSSYQSHTQPAHQAQSRKAPSTKGPQAKGSHPCPQTSLRGTRVGCAEPGGRWRGRRGAAPSELPFADGGWAAGSPATSMLPCPEQLCPEGF